MVETSFNLFDMVVIITLVLSTLLSFFRGFIREVLSLLGWFGAAMVTLYYAPDVAESIKGQIAHPMGAYIVASLLTFITTLVVISIITGMITRLLRKVPSLGVLDNGLGLLFGVLRAALLLSLGYYVLTFLYTEDNMPPWLAEAKTRPYVAQGAQILSKIAPEYLDSITPENIEGELRESGALEGLMKKETPEEAEGFSIDEAPVSDTQRRIEEQRRLLEGQ